MNSIAAITSNFRIRAFYEGVSNFLIFARRWVAHPKEVGTPFACSYAVGQKILQFIPNPSSASHRYLEIGPGTESFIAKKLGANDSLDLVEIDQVFCEMLKQKYAGRSNIAVHHMPIQNWKPSVPYDVVAGFVPLNALPSKEIAQPVLDSYERLTKSGGDLLVIGYIGTTALRRLTLFGDAKKKFNDVIALQGEFFKKHHGVVANIWRNFPPARVVCCKVSHL